MDSNTRGALMFLRRFSRLELEEIMQEVEKACPQFLSLLTRLREQSGLWGSGSGNTPRLSS